MDAMLLKTKDSEIRKRNYKKDEKRWDAAASAQTDQEFRDVLRIRADSISEDKLRRVSLTAIGLTGDCADENWV